MGKLKITRKTKLLPPVYIIIYHYLSLYHIISHPMFFLLNSPYENIRENSAAPGPWSKGWLPPRLLPGSWCTESPRPPAPRRRFRTQDLYGSLQNQPRSLIKMDLIVGIRIEHPTIAIIYGKVSSKWTTPQFNYIFKKKQPILTLWKLPFVTCNRSLAFWTHGTRICTSCLKGVSPWTRHRWGVVANPSRNQPQFICFWRVVDEELWQISIHKHIILYIYIYIPLFLVKPHCRYYYSRLHHVPLVHSPQSLRYPRSCFAHVQKW